MRNSSMVHYFLSIRGIVMAIVLMMLATVARAQDPGQTITVKAENATVKEVLSQIEN